ncbi:MAG: hypothetical protein H6883_05910 [Rhodobiaceae bacterium]|nr:hypothetical protein [Rhodobiaceae bacterium]MCC0055653.1 hypothetical protein [Rhodobiaceae bacterium]
MIYIVPSTMAATNRNTKPRNIVFKVFDLVMLASCQWWLGDNGTRDMEGLKALSIVQCRMNDCSPSAEFSETLRRTGRIDFALQKLFCGVSITIDGLKNSNSILAGFRPQLASALRVWPGVNDWAVSR